MSKALFTGANTVKGPALCRVSTRPAALTAATRVVWSFELTAFSMMFLDGYIGAPPTSTVISAEKAGTAKYAADDMRVATAAARAMVRKFMGKFLLFENLRSAMWEQEEIRRAKKEGFGWVKIFLIAQQPHCHARLRAGIQ